MLHALLIALMTVGILAAVIGFFTALTGLTLERLRVGLLGLAVLAAGLTLAITTGLAGGAAPSASPHPPVSHLGYGKF